MTERGRACGARPAGSRCPTTTAAKARCTTYSLGGFVTVGSSISMLPGCRCSASRPPRAPRRTRRPCSCSATRGATRGRRGRRSATRFARNGRAADVRSAAVGGTTAAAGRPRSLVNASRQLFPEPRMGPTSCGTPPAATTSARAAHRACSSTRRPAIAGARVPERGDRRGDGVLGRAARRILRRVPREPGDAAATTCAPDAAGALYGRTESRAPSAAPTSRARTRSSSRGRRTSSRRSRRASRRGTRGSTCSAPCRAGGVPGAASSARPRRTSARLASGRRPACTRPTGPRRAGDRRRVLGLYFRDRVSVPPPGGAGGPPAPAPPARGGRVGRVAGHGGGSPHRAAVPFYAHFFDTPPLFTSPTASHSDRKSLRSYCCV